MVLIVLGLFTAVALADRYWGTSILGGFVKARSNLIYEERPWWWKRILMYFVMATILTAVSLSPMVLFGPSAWEFLYPPLIALWAIVMLASLLAAQEDRS